MAMPIPEENSAEFSFFDGSVDDAIKKVKDCQTCLLVYVYGDDDTSKKYDGYFSSGGKLAQISRKFVCMRLAAQSDTALQFSAFYPVVSLPTIYLISADGISLEALIGDRSEEDLAERISSAAAAAVTSDAAVGAASGGATASWDSRVSRMEQKIETRQAEKAGEETQRDRQSELDRRSVGRSMNQLRQQQQEEQERAWAEEVRQERVARFKEQQKAKQPPPPPEQQQSSQQDSTLRDFRESQSAAYREERRAAEAARRAAEAAAEAAEREAAAAADLERRRTARLQFRCPDGRVFVRELPSSATLAELLESVSAAAEVANSPLRGRQFRLATVYPRRVFNRQSEASCTLAELELSPSASLLVLPPVDEGSSGGGNDTRGTVVSVLSAPFILLSRLLALLLGFVGALFSGGGGGSGAAAASSQSPRPAAETRRPRRPDGGATVERDGNTARLRNLPRSSGGSRKTGPDDDDDDEGATWNGNSTQQM